MQLAAQYGAWLLLAVLALALPALSHKYHRQVIREDWRRPLRLLLGLLESELGVVVVTYTWPILTTGTTTVAPTASQMASVPVLTAQVFFADTDTIATVVHNWGLPGSFNTAGFPIVIMTKSLGGASDSSFATNFTIGLSTNSVTINKIGLGTGQGGTYFVTLLRTSGPWLK